MTRQSCSMVATRMSRVRMKLRNRCEPAKRARKTAIGTTTDTSTGRASVSGPVLRIPVAPAAAASANHTARTTASATLAERLDTTWLATGNMILAPLTAMVGNGISTRQ